MSEISADEFTERTMCRILDSARLVGNAALLTLPSVETILAVTDEIEADQPCLICGKVRHALTGEPTETQ